MPHIKVLTESQVKIGVQQAVIDRAARFIIGTFGVTKKKVPFADFTFEVKEREKGEQVAILIESDGKPFLCLYHAKQTLDDGKDWGIAHASPDVWNRLPGLVATWQQKQRVEVFKNRATRRTSEFSHASDLR